MCNKQYWVQTQSPAGNWVDNLGTNDFDSAVRYAKSIKTSGRVVRVVVRKDKVVWTD